MVPWSDLIIRDTPIVCKELSTSFIANGGWDEMTFDCEAKVGWVLDQVEVGSHKP